MNNKCSCGAMAVASSQHSSWCDVNKRSALIEQSYYEIIESLNENWWNDIPDEEGWWNGD